LKENQIIVYENGEVEIKVSLDNQNETVWASVKEIAQIFEIDRTVVSRHIKNIFKDGELDENEVCANFAHTTQHGALNNKTQTKMVKYYNLDIILAVGYRTNSKKAIEFRGWATKILKQYIINGYTINSKKITVERFLNLEKDVISLKDDMKNINNLQYNNLTIKTSNKYHDRFLLINNKEAYHIGASLKDLGKKIFGFSKIDVELLNERVLSE